MDFYDERANQTLKGACHGATLALVALMGAYHAHVWRSPRGTPWHFWSAVVYISLGALEIVQIARHLPYDSR